MSIKTLVINPGSTSTKVGVFEDETLLFEETLRHPTEEIAKYASVIDQKDFRKEIILDFLKEKNCDPKTLNVIVGRGGLLKPIPGGTYAVSDALLTDLKAGVQGQHASNLGGILAREIGDSLGVPSYIVDPVVVDELTDKARISGMPELPRRSIFHALNQKAVARRFAKENGKRYEDLNLIVIHMGGGVSVGAHDHGKVVDVNNILDGEGCFSPERSGTVPVGDLVKMCFSGKYTQKEVYKKICGNGGFNGYLHTNDAREVGRSGNKMLLDEVVPILPLDQEDCKKFAAAVQDRFNNPFVNHELMSISLNSTSKWRARNMPSFLEYVGKNGKLPTCLTMSFAAYIAFYSNDVQELTDKGLVCKRAKGNEYTVSDDRWVLEFYNEHKNDDVPTLVHAVMTNEQMWGQDLTKVPGFEEATVKNLTNIRENGALAAYASCL